MKVFAFLLSAFFMTLTVMPCSDAASGWGGKVCMAEDIHLEPDQEEHADLCTPFCVCSCCGISMAVSEITELLPDKSVLAVTGDMRESEYRYSLLLSTGIWQPPRWC